MFLVDFMGDLDKARGHLFAQEIRVSLVSEETAIRQRFGISIPYDFRSFEVGRGGDDTGRLKKAVLEFDGVRSQKGTELAPHRCGVGNGKIATSSLAGIFG